MAHLGQVGVALFYHKTQLRVGENCGIPAGKLNSSRGGEVSLICFGVTDSAEGRRMLARNAQVPAVLAEIV